MKIIVAKNSGFCFGVERAIKTAENKMTQEGANIYSLGPLIHNNQEIKRLEEKGLGIINNIENIKNSKIIIRSHGVPKATIETAINNNMDLIDCTCPFVKKIQEKVREYHSKGYTIIIIGNPEHPEVIGINGWCDNCAFIINSEDDIEDIPKCDKICIVAQTTITLSKFKRLSNLASKKGNQVKIFNTICNATKLRQNSCEDVAKEVDAMIVIGGFHSSNTQKLVDISNKYCAKTYHIETVDDLPQDELYSYSKIGITAGASTPDWIIEEVINKMNNGENNMNEMMEAIENSMVNLYSGDIVKGTVISVNDNEVMVNIGYKSDGIIKKNEFSDDPYIVLTEEVNQGDEIEVYVIKLNDDEGNVVLSKKRVDAIKGFEDLEAAYNNQETVKAKVVEVVKGGAIAVVNGLRGFIPASHLAVGYVEDITPYLGKDLEVKIIEFDKGKKRIVLSRKLIEEAELVEKKNELWRTIEEGQKIPGVVKRLTNFGAFVDIGGIDGLIHISELTWGRVNHPSEVVKEGDEVEVIVLGFDKEKERISLGLKQTIEHPWDNITDNYHTGDIVEGKVVNLINFGAFVELEPGIEGLVHISQIANERINKPSDVLKIGEIVKVKILEIKEDDQKISLSIKEVESKEEQEEVEQYNNEEEVTIEDIMDNK